MAKINITRPHGRSQPEAQAAIERAADQLGGEFGLSCSCDADGGVRFERSGVSGTIRADASDVHVKVELGFLASAMKPVIEKEIRRHLDEQFG
ncbi:MAG: polyhydroxyalkanoic acid system family protein [Dokdonella sp.]